MITYHQLQTLPLFVSLTDDDASTILPLFQKKSIKKKEHIILAHDDSESIIFIISGSVKVRMISNDAKEIIFSYLKSGDYFGEIALLTNTYRSADVVALEDCIIASLSKKHFDDLLHKHSTLAYHLLQSLAARLRLASIKISELALLPISKRLENTLLHLSKTQNGEKIIEQRPSHQEMAALIGTSREMVTRAFKLLEEEGKITIDNKTIRFPEDR